jgi:hypothetical protein
MPDDDVNDAEKKATGKIYHIGFFRVITGREEYGGGGEE